MQKPKIYTMPFAKVYPHYIAKVEKKGMHKKDVDEIITWLTGYQKDQLNNIISQAIDFERFFNDAPNLNPYRFQIKGSICGIKVESIEEPLMQNIRYLDKLIDDVSKGKSLNQILMKYQI